MAPDNFDRDDKSEYKKVFYLKNAAHASSARKLVSDKIQSTPWNSPLIIRGLDGQILFWNPAAEQRYGWSHQEAMGNSSHALLSTVFPEPLDLINYELINRGYWKGELIHTRSDGTRVKVSSRWELYRDAEGRLCTVLEINDKFSLIDPGSSFLEKSFGAFGLIRRLSLFLASNKRWWLAPIFIGSIILGIFIYFTHHHPHAALVPTNW